MLLRCPVFPSIFRVVLIASALALAAHSALAQSGAYKKPTPTPTPTAEDAQEEERVFTEEVRIPVFAYDEHGRFDPSLELDDVLIVEDDVPQQVRSVRHIPASVLLLLGAGGSDLNPAVRTATMRDIALGVISNLHEGDPVAVFQLGSKTDVVQEWTADREQLSRSLKSKLTLGKTASLAQVISRAASYLQTQPVGNRHLVLITDGVETNSRSDYERAIRQLIGAQATVHVISYTAIGERMMKEQDKKPKEVAGMAQSTADMATVGIDPTRAPGQRGSGINPPQVNGGIRFDPQLRRERKAYRDAMRRAEARLKSLVDETGGLMFLPASTEEMVARGTEVAREIGAQYVVTYRPKRPLTGAPAGEYRWIRVAPRRLGLQLRARRNYVVGAMRDEPPRASGAVRQ